jgi:endonuclease III
MNWNHSLQPLFKKYGSRRHPLDYKNTYQLVVMVVLSAQTTDVMVNAKAPALFQKFPSMIHLAATLPEELYPWIKSIRGFRKKADWLIRIAQAIGEDKNIPLSLEQLIALPGIGRKSANVIIREAGGTPQGIFLDLHVLRVVPRLGITTKDKPEKMEKILMDMIPRNSWHAAGMSFSYLGRELCRPTNPQCSDCLLQKVCMDHLHRKKTSL